MMRNRVLVLLVLLLAACRSAPPPQPTLPPATEIPAIPTSPGVETVETAVSATPPPATETPPPSPTPSPLPTRTPTIAAPPSPTAGPPQERITIAQPAAAAAAVAGQPFTFSGEVVPVISTTLTLQVQVARQTVFSTPLPFDVQNGAWSLTRPLPPVAGPAEVRVMGADAAAAVDFRIEPPLDQPGPYVTLAQPAAGQIVAAGYTLHLSGTSRDLFNSSLTMAVLAENCTLTVAAFSFNLSGGAWSGELIVPQATTPGPGCAIAYTGTRGEENWREMRLPLTIVPADDGRARYIRLGNPPGLTFAAGETAVVYGVAANAPDGQVQVSLLLGSEEDSGTVLAAAPAAVDAFGYWEVPLTVPAGQTGPALLLVAMGSGETYTELRAETAVTP